MTIASTSNLTTTGFTKIELPKYLAQLTLRIMILSKSIAGAMLKSKTKYCKNRGR